jgi:hypothetical protein
VGDGVLAVSSHQEMSLQDQMLTPCPQDQTCTASKQMQSVMKLSKALCSIAIKVGKVHQGSSALKANITTAEGSMGPGLPPDGADRRHVCVQQTPVTRLHQRTLQFSGFPAPGRLGGSHPQCPDILVSRHPDINPSKARKLYTNASTGA